MKTEIPKNEIEEAEACYLDAINTGHIDTEIVPMLQALKQLSPYVYPNQSCAGHQPYYGNMTTYAKGNGVFQSSFRISKKHRPMNASKYWGYIAVFLAQPIFDYILANAEEVVKENPWMIFTMSQPVGKNNFMFSFDRNQWPLVEKTFPEYMRKLVERFCMVPA